MAKQDKQPAPADDPEEGDGEKKVEEKQAFVKKLLGNKKLLLIAAGGLVALLLAGGGGLYFFVFSGSDDSTATASAIPPMPAVPPQIAYFDVPDLIVNIQTNDGSPVYLKVSLALELYTADEKPGLQALLPRIVDQYQGYLRELRPDDFKGSAGIMRLKEELLRRTNVAAAPYHVRDVLLKEMILQ